MSEYNLLSLFHRLTTGEEYATPPPSGDQVKGQMSVIEEIDEEEENNDKKLEEALKPNAREHTFRGPLFSGETSRGWLVVCENDSLSSTKNSVSFCPQCLHSGFTVFCDYDSNLIRHNTVK